MDFFLAADRLPCSRNRVQAGAAVSPLRTQCFWPKKQFISSDSKIHCNVSDWRLRPIPTSRRSDNMLQIDVAAIVVATNLNFNVQIIWEWVKEYEYWNVCDSKVIWTKPLNGFRLMDTEKDRLHSRGLPPSLSPCDTRHTHSVFNQSQSEATLWHHPQSSTNYYLIGFFSFQRPRLGIYRGKSFL